MNNRFRLVVFGLLFALAVSMVTATPAQARIRDAKLLRNLPVNGALVGGGTFAGTLTITEVGYDEAKGLTVSGVLRGTARPTEGRSRRVAQEFSDLPATLNEVGGTAGVIGTQPASAAVVAQQASCDILFLDLGPLSLDLLGLTVDLSQIVLDVNAVPGAGNLLGNLLCAVAGLLDPGGLLGDLLGGLQVLLNILNAINDAIS